MNMPTVAFNSSLAEAIDAIQVGGERGAIVLGEDARVIGILTEGDIVRAVRRGVLMESPVEQVVTTMVELETGPLSAAELLQKFAQRGILMLPIVDDDRHLLSVQYSRDAAAILLREIRRPN